MAVACTGAVALLAVAVLRGPALAVLVVGIAVMVLTAVARRARVPDRTAWGGNATAAPQERPHAPRPARETPLAQGAHPAQDTSPTREVDPTPEAPRTPQRHSAQEAHPAQAVHSTREAHPAQDTHPAQEAHPAPEARPPELSGAASQRIRHLEALLRTARHLAAARHLHDVYGVASVAAREIFGAARVALVHGGGPGRHATVLAEGLSQGLARALSAHAVGDEAPFAVAAEPVMVPVFADDQRTATLAAAAAPDGLTGGLFLPLRVREEGVGTLVLLYGRRATVPRAMLQLAGEFADCVAAAVHQTTLLARSVHERREAALLTQILQSVSGSLEPSEVLQRAATGIAHVSGALRVCAYRVDGSRLQAVAQVGTAASTTEAPLESGLLARVVRTGRPEFVVGADDAGGWGETPAISRAAVPVLLDGTPVAVLMAEGTADHPVTAELYELLVAIAQHLTVAMRNAALFEEVRRARDELQVLYETARAVSGTLDLPTLLDTLVSVTCRVFGYDLGALLLVDGETGELVVEAAYGYRTSVVGLRLSPGTGITGWVAQTGTPLIVDDVRQDPRYYAGDSRTRSELAVPLVAEGNVLGVLNVESGRVGAFGQRDLQLLTAVASYAVLAVQNARLFAQTRRLAITDGLTELYNYRYLYETLERLVERARRDDQPLSLIMLEIDGFKRFNDAYGHRRGDEVLRRVAMWLRRGSRPSDVVARYGGDEFMVVLPGVPKAAAVDTAERLRRSVESHPLVLGDEEVASVTLSVGVASFPDDGQTVDALVEAVDRAQYAAKRSGGNRVRVAHGA